VFDIRKLYVCLALTALMAVSPVFAQFDSGAVLGTIQDPSGLSIGGAKVTLESLETGVQRTVNADESGSFEFLNVRIGNYRLTAEREGFKKASSADFRLTVGARQRVDLALQVGSVSESVTITDAVAALETETSSRGTVIGAEQTVNLPLNGRNYADLALLAPGVRRSAIAESRDASFNVNGMRSSQNNFVIDGVDNNSYGTSNQGFSNQVVQLSPDAVQEFRLETNNFSAEYGRAGGAVINATIRSGTNEFHGAAWEYLRNTKLNAVGFFKPATGKPDLIQNQFGGAIGGPIVKDKMFFFADYEGFRRVSKQVTFADVPTLDQRQGNLGIPIRNPYTGEVYADGRIPQNLITPWAREVLSQLPAPNLNTTARNLQTLPRRTDQNDKGDVRYDQYFNESLNGFVRYSHRLLNNLEPPAIPGLAGGDSNGNVRVLNQQIAFGATKTLSPTSLLEFRMGVSLTEGGKTPLFVGTEPLAQRLNIPNAPTDPRFTGGIYAQQISGYTSLGVQGSNPQFQNPFVVNPKVNWSKIAGRHSLKAGYEFQHISTEIDDFNPKAGTDVYAGRFSQAPIPAGTPVPGNVNALQNLADFLLGARSRYQLNTANIVNLRQRMNFFYLQDDFKVSPKLTLNLGIRYEVATPQWERDNALSNFDPATNTIIQASDGSIEDRALVRVDRNNWAPRVGGAYQLTSKTVLRAAYGMSYIHFNRLGGENLLAYNLPWILNPFVDQIPAGAGGLPLCTSLDQRGGTCFRPTQQGYPNGFLSVNNVNQTLVRTNYIPQDLSSGYIHSYHFTIQQELPMKFVLDLAYVGTRAEKLMILGDFNQARPNNVGENISLQARRPLQNFGYIQAAFPGGFLNYNALQVKVERRFSEGFYFLNSFTWSKAIDNASGHLEANNGDNSRVNFRNLDAERGLSGYDVPFLNATTILYDIPFGRGRKFGNSWNRGFDAVLGGWRITAINFAQSGIPVNLSYDPSSAFQVSGAPTYRPNITGNPVLPESERSPSRWLNPATVVIPTDVSQPFGNAGRNIVRAPSLHQLNFGLHKDFSITERQTLQFRMEAFNFFNKTNFNPPNGNRSSGSFGQITSTQPARQIQFALRYAF
jgi:hypothetical protein